MRAIRAPPPAPASAITAAQPRLEAHHLARRRAPLLARSRARRAAVAVARDPPRAAACRRGSRSAPPSRARPGGGRSAAERLPITCSSSRSRPGRRRSESSCVPSSRLKPAERARPNSRTTCSAATAENSSITTSVGTGAALQRRDRRLQVLHDRRAEHLGEQRPAVGLEAEVDDRPRRAPRSSRSKRSAPAVSRIQPRPDVGLGEDRQPVAHAGEIALLARGQRVQVGDASPRASASGRLAGEQLQPRRVEAARRSPRRLTSAAARAQRAHHVAEIALRLAQVVGLGEALAGERLVGDLGLASRARTGCRRDRPCGVHSMKRRPASPAARRSCSRIARSPFGSSTIAPIPRSIARARSTPG